MGDPKNCWFIMENPSIRGWFRGTPISGTPQKIIHIHKKRFECCTQSFRLQPLPHQLRRWRHSSVAAPISQRLPYLDSSTARQLDVTFGESSKNPGNIFQKTHENPWKSWENQGISMKTHDKWRFIDGYRRESHRFLLLVDSPASHDCRRVCQL